MPEDSPTMIMHQAGPIPLMSTPLTSFSPQSPSPHNSKKRRGNLPKACTNLLKKWLFDHLFHPYPTEEEKSALSMQTGLSSKQISDWFINARRRILQPMLESVRQQQVGSLDSQMALVGNGSMN